MYNLKNITVFDVEANGFLHEADRIHCIVTVNAEGLKQWHDSPMLERSGSVSEGIDYLAQQDTVAGHNIIGYDLPLIKKLYKRTFTKTLDTFILSQLLFANERQSHGLAEWGKVFGIPKPEQEQWLVFNKEMLHRCTEDSKINQKLLVKCLEEIHKDNWDWSQSINLEHEVYTTYMKHGTRWKIDLALLEKKLEFYNALYNKINYQLSVLKKPDVIQGKETKAFTKKGELSAAAITHNAVGDFTKIAFKPFEPSSVKQLTEFLLSKGWKPQTFTPTNAPSLRDDPLIGVPGDIKAVISDFRDTIHRRGVLEGFKKRAKEDGTIEMFAYTCGTNTGRFRHNVVANIQPEFKDLFIASEGNMLVGADASQLEARIEGHYTQKYDKGQYAHYLLEMDVHQFNANSWGVTRDKAKAPFYAMTYGAGAGKLAKMLEVSEHHARDIINQHYETFPGLKLFIQHIEKCLDRRGFLTTGQWGKKELNESIKPWVKGIDGRKLYVRGMHKLKNTVVQSAGSICVKKAYVEIAKEIDKNNLDAKIVMFYHDEFVVEVKNDAAQIKLLTEIVENAIVKSGEHFKLSIPLKGEAKVGKNWKEVK